MPPYEPERTLQKFADRAAHWQKVIDYDHVQCDGASPVSTVRYTISGSNPAAYGKRLAFLSDAHFHASAEDFVLAESAYRIIEAFNPDYFLLGGDVAGYADQLPLLPDFLRIFRDLPCPKIAVNGNWEAQKCWLNRSYWQNMYQKNGFIFLCDDFFNDDALMIFGASDISTVHTVHYPAWPQDGGRMKIILAHNPDSIISYDSRMHPDALGDLSICGHTHGGQVRLPFIGALTSSSIYGRHFDYGMYKHRQNDSRMIISSGLSSLTWGRLRCGCRREVLLLTLD